MERSRFTWLSQIGLLHVHLDAGKPRLHIDGHDFSRWHHDGQAKMHSSVRAGSPNPTFARQSLGRLHSNCMPESETIDMQEQDEWFTQADWSAAGLKREVASCLDFVQQHIESYLDWLRLCLDPCDFRLKMAWSIS